MPRNPEYAEARVLWDWLCHQRHLRDYVKHSLIFHVANERKTTPQAGARLKAIGVQAGVSDYLFLVPSGVYHGLAIELKRPGVHKGTEAQMQFLHAANSVGYRAEIASGAADAITIICDYFSPLFEMKPLRVV